MSTFTAEQKMSWLERLPKRVSSAAMILENADGKVLVVKANYKSYWTLPGGVVDPGETPKEAALRETLEEVGIDIHPEAVSFVAVVDRTSERAQTYQFIFKAPLAQAMIDHVSLQASEIDEYALVTKDQVLAGDRHYAKALTSWATGETGYMEQRFNINE